MHRKVKKSVQSFHGSPQQFCSLHFCAGIPVKFQTQNQNGKYQDIPATETYELNQAKEAWKLNVQLGTNKISGKLNSFLENGKTSVFPIFRIRVC